MILASLRVTPWLLKVQPKECSIRQPKNQACFIGGLDMLDSFLYWAVQVAQE